MNISSIPINLYFPEKIINILNIKDINTCAKDKKDIINQSK